MLLCAVLDNRFIEQPECKFRYIYVCHIFIYLSIYSLFIVDKQTQYNAYNIYDYHKYANLSQLPKIIIPK